MWLSYIKTHRKTGRKDVGGEGKLHTDAASSRCSPCDHVTVRQAEWVMGRKESSPRDFFWGTPKQRVMKDQTW